MNVTEMCANCGSRNARCSVSAKVEIISLAFKWLIVLKSALKTRDQKRTELRLPRPKTRKKRTFTRLVRKLNTHGTKRPKNSTTMN